MLRGLILTKSGVQFSPIARSLFVLALIRLILLILLIHLSGKLLL